MNRLLIVSSTVLCVATMNAARAQVSSIGALHRQEEASRPPEKLPREIIRANKNLVYERFGWTAATTAPVKTFKPDDLITIIVREQKQWQANSDLQRRQIFDAKSELDAFIKATGGGIGAATFQRGKPNIDYKFNQDNRSTGESQREDKFTTRISARILDVKPNGILVLEGRAKFTHDDEFSEITIIGSCRKEDVTADNTVLSTQLADKEVSVRNSGALKSAATQGWVAKLLDLLKPW